MASGRFPAVLGPPWLCAWRTQAALPPAGRSVWGAGSPRPLVTPRAFLPRLVCLRDPQAVRSWRTWGRTWPRASSKGTKPTWKTHPSSGGHREGGPTRLQHHQCGHSHAHTPHVHTRTSGPAQLEGSSWAGPPKSPLWGGAPAPACMPVGAILPAPPGEQSPASPAMQEGRWGHPSLLGAGQGETWKAPTERPGLSP